MSSIAVWKDMLPAAPHAILELPDNLVVPFSGTISCLAQQVAAKPFCRTTVQWSQICFLRGNSLLQTVHRLMLLAAAIHKRSRPLCKSGTTTTAMATRPLTILLSGYHFLRDLLSICHAMQLRELICRLLCSVTTTL